MSLRFADIDRIDWDKGGGLVPVIVQNVHNGAVLMLAWMNREALRATLEKQRAVFYSRSKQRLWEKGETSGNHLNVVEIKLDCDADTLLLLAVPEGPTCHTGTVTCFGDEALTDAERLSFIGELEQTIKARIAERPEGSYTARLLAQGQRRIAQKVGEEGVEVALAGAGESDAQLLGESADLLYHLLVLLRSRELSLQQLVDELRSRHRTLSKP